MDTTDEAGIKSIVEAYKEVTSLGVDAVIYEHDRVTTVDFLVNLMDMYGDIGMRLSQSHWL